jgi:hypothetical protein
MFLLAVQLGKTTTSSRLDTHTRRSGRRSSLKGGKCQALTTMMPVDESPSTSDLASGTKGDAGPHYQPEEMDSNDEREE